MLEKLGNAIKKVTDSIASAIFVDKELIEKIIKDLQRALIEADVNVLLVKELSEELRKKAADEKIKGIEKKEQIIKSLNDKLLTMLGKEKAKFEPKKGNKVLLLGLYGSGKTTTTAKLANYYNKRGLKSCILGLDVHRPAASEQLEQLGKQNNIQVFVDKKEKNPIKIYDKYKKETEDYDLLIVDTAGRHTLDKDLVEEIKAISKKISPDYIFLVIPADIGQLAKKLASDFKKSCNINGVIITRMDSSAKGGGALTACSETDSQVIFITTGEKINDLEVFNPTSFISRILGLGDLEALLEKVQSAVDKNKQKETQKRLEEGKFNLKDLYEQLESMENIGTFDKIMEFIPGLGKAKIPENMMNVQQEKMKKWKYAIQSMTKEEIENPEILEKQTSRLARIAKGSGTATSDVRALIKQYRVMKDFIKTGQNLDMSKGLSGMSQKHIQKLAKKFGKKMKF